MLQRLIFGLLERYLLERIFSKPKKYLNFNSSNFDLFTVGKRSTIRLGHVKYELGRINVLSNGIETPLFIFRIIEINKKRFGDLTLNDARQDGYQTLADLRYELEVCYQTKIYNKTKITQIILQVDD
jgi:hypothetical protein